MNRETRGVCPDCGRIVYRRLDGALRLHRDQDGQGCDGGGVNHEEVNREIHRLARYAIACDQIGAGHLWSLVAYADNPSTRLARDLLGSLALAFVDMGIGAGDEAA